jgi:hypothetical protein
MATVIVNPGNTLIVSAPGPQGPQGAGGGGGGSGTVTSVTAGDGLLGGTITTSGTIDVNFGSAGNTVCEGNDARLSDARTPTTHSHVAGDIGSITGPALLGRQAATTGTAEAITLGSGLTIDGSKQLSISASYAQQSVTMTAGTGLTGGGDLSANRTFAVSYGSTASTACEGNDARLSDARTPTTHTHAPSDITQGGATTGQVLEWSGSAWAPATPSGGGGIDVSTTAFEFSDFINSDLGATATASGGQVNYSVSGADPGRMWVNTSANGTANARGLLISNNGLGTIDVQENTSLDLAASAYAGSTGGTNYTGHLRFGYGDSQNHVLPSNGVYFRSEATGGAGGNWYAVTVNGGTETATDTGTAENATAKRFRINISTISSTRTARFYIDGSLVATHTTNLPTAAVGWVYAAVRTGTETVAKQLYVEWHRHEITRATALSFT